jgi:tRNA(adenine34) deaminase
MASTPMEQALELAAAAARAGEVPVGAVITRGGAVIAEAANRMRALADPLAHAEILAIRQALAATGDAKLEACDLYVTLEPCTMCAGAISLARLRRLYYGAVDPKAGAVDSGVRYFAQPTCHHAPEVIGGMNEREAGELLRSFFQARR